MWNWGGGMDLVSKLKYYYCEIIVTINSPKATFNL